MGGSGNATHPHWQLAPSPVRDPPADGNGPDDVGTREPRRPLPSSDTDAIALPDPTREPADPPA